LRSVYTGDPFTSDGYRLQLPAYLKDEVIVREIYFDGIRCLIYSPLGRLNHVPLILYMHGGGFVIGCSEDTDYVTRMLCYSNRAVVISVNYRLAPETMFPGALADCDHVLDLAIAQANDFSVDTNQIFLCGDSAGANLAAALYLHLSPERRASIKGLMLLAPWLDMHVERYDSYNSMAPTGIVFDAPFIGFARAAYAPFNEWNNPLVSPIFGSLRELPSTLVIVGTEDPLLDQTLKLKDLARDQLCDQVAFKIYGGMPHCFYSFPDLFIDEQDCWKQISSFMSEIVGSR
jgi:acetyl esterase